jgi:hypothetical protein
MCPPSGVGKDHFVCVGLLGLTREGQVALVAGGMSDFEALGDLGDIEISLECWKYMR